MGEDGCSGLVRATTAPAPHNNNISFWGESSGESLPGNNQPPRYHFVIINVFYIKIEKVIIITY